MPAQHRVGPLPATGTRRTVPSYNGTMTRSPSGANATPLGILDGGSRKTTRFAPVARSHTATIPSSPALATVRPSGDRLAPNAHPLCAFRTAKGRDARRGSHTFTTPSRPAVVTRWPSLLPRARSPSHGGRATRRGSVT